MNAKHLFLAFLLNIIGLITNAQTFEWAKQMGGTGAAVAHSIAIDISGNVYTVGAFQGTIDFDPGADTFNLSSADFDDIFISKLDASGNFVWTKQMGGTGGDAGLSIAVDASGNIYTTGFFRSTADFDPGAGTFNLVSAGDRDIFISKLDTFGIFVWAKKMGGANGDAGRSIAADVSGNVYTTGFFRGTADFDPGAGTFNLVSLGGFDDIFISKLDALGNFVWAKQISGPGDDRGLSIKADASGNAFTTGFFGGTVDFDPGTGTFNLSSAGSRDIFISKLDALGSFVWAKQMGGTNYDDFGNSIAVDASGNVYTTGIFAGTADFDPGAGTFSLISSSGFHDIFISKLDASGNFAWAKQMGGPSTDAGLSIAADASGNVYTTGVFTGTADFDPGVGIFNLSSSDSLDIFISKLDASGAFLWAKQIGGTGIDQGLSIAVNALGNVYTTGFFQGTADFDPGAGTFNLISSGGNNVFVHKMSQTPTGLSVSVFDKAHIVYPNPTSGQINIVLGENASKTNIVVRNGLGQEVFRKSYSSANIIELTIEGESGLYLLEISQNDEQSVAKVIKY